MNKALGRGLSSLLGEINNEVEARDNSKNNNVSDVINIAVTEIINNKSQPRKVFAQQSINELAQSIKQNGLLQPIILRKVNDKYEIIAGERRWRACKQLNLSHISAKVLALNESEAMLCSILENIQRENLNPIEEAEAYFQLMQDFGYTQEELSNSLSKSRSHIANILRIKSLPEEVKEMLVNGEITLGHAKILVKQDNPSEIAKKITDNNFTVRQLEKFLKGDSNKQPIPQKHIENQENITNKDNTSIESNDDNIFASQNDSEIGSIESYLTDLLKMRVMVKQYANVEGGEVVIKYKNSEQLDQLLQKLDF